MKHFINFMKYSLFLSLVVAMVSCGGDDNDDGDEEEDPRQEKADLFVNEKATIAAESDVTLDGNASDESFDWAGFEITFSGGVDGGTFTTNATGNQLEVWPTSGNWTFGDDNGNTIQITNGALMNLNVGSNELKLTFDLDGSINGRIKVVEGEWEFSFGL